MEFQKCSDCPATELLPGNLDTWLVYARCWNQVIVAGLGTVIGLRLDAVYRIMESLEIPRHLQLDIVDKVSLLHSTTFPIEEKKDKNGNHSNPSHR